MTIMRGADTVKAAKQFQTMEEVDSYLDADLIPCLICGKLLKFFPSHLQRVHEVTVEEYKREFGIPPSRPLMGKATRAIHKENSADLGKSPEYMRSLRARPGSGWSRRIIPSVPAVRNALAKMAETGRRSRARNRGREYCSPEIALAIARAEPAPAKVLALRFGVDERSVLRVLRGQHVGLPEEVNRPLREAHAERMKGHWTEEDLAAIRADPRPDAEVAKSLGVEVNRVFQVRRNHRPADWPYYRPSGRRSAWEVSARVLEEYEAAKEKP